MVRLKILLHKVIVVTRHTNSEITSTGIIDKYIVYDAIF